MENKVVSLSDFRKCKNTEPAVPSSEKRPLPSESFDFEETLKRNKDNGDRLNQERNKSNSGVIRSYNLKQ